MRKVHIFIPCFVDQLYPSVGFNMVKLLEKAGCEVSYSANQTCCGQPAFNAGFKGEAKEVCIKFLDDFKQAETIVTPSASCAGFIKNYYTGLLEETPYKHAAQKIKARIFELSDFLVNRIEFTDFGAELNTIATYHDSCAALRECKVKQEPRILLGKVKGLELKEMNDVETCCGFGGTFAVKFESISIAMADQKIHHASQTGAATLVSTDMSCLMHIDGCMKHQQKDIKVMHLADVLTSGW